jgi:glutaconate CoA-transferase, subunit B
VIAARRVCWALAEECRDDDVAVVGVGTPLAGAAAFLARELLVPGLTIIVGGAVDPPLMDIAEVLVDPTSVTRSARGVLGQRELLPMLQRGTITLQFISPAQVDREGAVNTSRVRDGSGWRDLPGCLAIPDTTALVGRLVAYRLEGGERFMVGRVDHVTGLGRAPDLRARFGLSGRGVIAVVTEQGRLELDDPRRRWRPLDDPSPEANELLDRVIDPHHVIELETKHGRQSARDTLARLATSRS